MTPSLAIRVEAIICLGGEGLRPVSLLQLSGVQSRQLDSRCWIGFIEEVIALLAFSPHVFGGDTQRN